jgi:NitT/TauT family transport system permease protein
VKTWSSIIAPAFLIALLVGVWGAAWAMLHIAPYLLPSPQSVGLAMVQGAGLLLSGAARTLLMAMEALVVASLFGNGVAILISLNRTLEQAVLPLAVGLQVMPVVAIAPLVVIWTGVDHPDRAIVILAAIVAFFPIFSGALTGLASADPDLERLFRLYGANPLQKLIRLKLPSAIPFVLEGHKVASGLAIIGAVVAEFVAGSGGAQGLAWRILEASNRLRTDKMFAAIIALAVMAAVLRWLFNALEARALKWWRGR